MKALEVNSAAHTVLKDVCHYKNDSVIYSFLETYPISYDEADDIFQEMKKWLWLNYYLKSTQEDVKLVIDEPIIVIDEMWHKFILFTKAYAKFCTHYFNDFIHHNPTTYSEKKAFYQKQHSSPDFILEIEEKKKTQYGIIYDLLGEDTLIKWYSTYKECYSMERLKSLLN